MTPRKRTEITIETDRLVIIRRQHSTRAWCEKCGCDVDVVQAEILASMAQPRLGGGGEVRKWHSVEAPDGTPLVCLPSLLKSM
jgi:hypothetical protein